MSREFREAALQLNHFVASGHSFSGKERSCCFLNLGLKSNKFANISAASGIDYPDDGRALVTVDWDQDGDLDILTSQRNAPRVRFFRNDIVEDQHYLMLKLVGNGQGTSRDAIGARVELLPEVVAGVESGSPEQILERVKTLRAGDGFLSQSSKWLHFGLGDNSEDQVATVYWPGGEKEVFPALAVNNRYKLVQGTGRAEKLKPRNCSFDFKATPVEKQGPSGAERIPLVTLVPTPILPFKKRDGSEQDLPIGKGRPVLVNLWATWCGPCRKELVEFTARKEDFAKHGIDVVALCMDPLGKEKTDPQAATTFLEQIGFPFTQGTATEELAKVFQLIHDALMATDAPLPAPTSFLIDGDGRLSVIYKGPVDVDQVIADCAHSSKTREERYQEAAAHPGRIMEARDLEEKLKSLVLSTLIQIGEQLKQRNLLADAERVYYTAVRIQDLALLRNNLGGLLLDQDKLAEATLHLNRALEMRPEYAKALSNLAAVKTDEKQINEAIELYEKAIEITPKLAIAHFNLAEVFVGKGERQKAVDHYLKCLEADPELHIANIKLARLQMKNGQLEEAKEHYEQAVKQSSEDPVLLSELGLVLLLLDQPQEAVERFEQALAIAPDYSDAKEHLHRAKLAIQRQNRKKSK